MTTTFAIILITGIAIAASLVLVVLYNQRRQNKTEKLLSGFNEAADEFHLSITKQEILGDRVIGFDEENNKLLFIKTGGNKHDGYLIDLDEIQRCTVKKEYGTVHTGMAGRRSAEAYVNTIALQLDYKNGSKPLVLPFYDKATHPVFEMRERAQQAREWQILLSAAIPKKIKMDRKETEVAVV